MDVVNITAVISITVCLVWGFTMFIDDEDYKNNSGRVKIAEILRTFCLFLLFIDICILIYIIYDGIMINISISEHEKMLFGS